ncbi:type II toxin-antitoxin system HicA family toxin [Limnoraphis robusta]|uniref:Type II toxin-antitoxin system HicA family toxin n=1 Tax=Limnoraphis robusta CCNP1315 TaxID=3110306 RepID=A0ABU5U5J8_9CYAN|nr:type II toxin-antitoxin system HicA family toxin [Limnoraphis robusta]MEA5522476.1 type II toxin-antitoxin system HicA family toxin [Limnoraphis robusta CCNP1315]MEA5546234.1 type II toxin-antitoxin system HicA family toxin [Limnoraphis robusta CCNP1324]
MSNIPILKPQEVVRILENFGFVEVRQKGSHKQFRH